MKSRKLSVLVNMETSSVLIILRVDQIALIHNDNPNLIAPIFNNNPNLKDSPNRQKLYTILYAA